MDPAKITCVRCTHFFYKKLEMAASTRSFLIFWTVIDSYSVVLCCVVY